MIENTVTITCASTDICDRCGQHPATELWVEDGILGYIHGLSSRWCRRCVIEAQITHAKLLALALPELERQLTDLGDA